MKKVENMTRDLFAEALVLILAAAIRIFIGLATIIVIVANLIVSALLAMIRKQRFRDSFTNGMNYFYSYVEKMLISADRES